MGAVVLVFTQGNDTREDADITQALAKNYCQIHRPASSRRLRLCYDPRTLLKKGKPDQATVHAKAVEIDRRKAFMTSANLTE